MSRKNRLHKTSKKDRYDSESILHPCLQIDSHVELKEIPTTGEEYLLTVIKEREKYAVVTKCNRDFSVFAKNQSTFAEEIPQVTAVHERLKPTIEWQNIQVADFSDVRMYMSRMLASLTTKLKPTEIVEDNITGWKKFFELGAPTLTCILGLKHAHADKALEVLVHILQRIKHGDTIDHRTGQWIYALLAAAKLPLYSDTCSIIRNVARQCAEIRSHIDPESENANTAVAPLNIFICLVGRYFRQYDLADT